MKCISCQVEINPQWRHAIDINVCPFCGKHIMEDNLKQLLSSLAATMEALKPYSDQLDDWLLSNYNYIKTDSPDIKLYLPKDAISEIYKEVADQEVQKRKTSVVKIKTKDEDGNIIEQDVVVENLQSDDRAQLFHDRANNFLKQEKVVDGDSKSVSEKTKHLREMANRIKREGTEIVAEDDQIHLTSSKITDADPEMVAVLEAAIDPNNGVSSGLMPETGDDEVPSIVLNMANRAKNKNSSNNEEEVLRKMENKVNDAQRRFNSGKGRFSRA